MTAADAMRMLATLLVRVEDGLIELRPIRPSGEAGSPEFISVSETPRVSERAVALRADFNVYFGVAPRTRARGTKDAVGLVPALWAHLDSQVARQSLDAFELPPSIVVSSGSGENRHAYWVLEQPVEPTAAEEINRALAARLGSDERVVDAGRVLRLPGILNHKTSPPSEVRLEHLDARRFTPETLRAALGDAGAGQEQAAQPDESSRPVALVLARLEGVRPGSSGWQAHCPAHDDRNPSLSIGQGDDGRALIYCHRGCEPEAVLAKVGLTFRDLFPADPPSAARSLSALLVDLVAAADIELFHDNAGRPLAWMVVADHREVWPVESQKFRRWLRHELKRRHGRLATAQALADAVDTIAAEAEFDGPEREVSVRVAATPDSVLLDLGDEEWQVVEITAEGWSVLPTSPLPFIRRGSTLPLPIPVKGGSVEELLPFVNLPGAASEQLVIGFLVMALQPHGPFPILVPQGEQGSAKSTLARMLRALVDPVKAPLRAGTPTERDLMITASRQWIVGFDNVSKLSDRLSDALCQLSTGAGFATRQLYSDDEEVVFEAMRPAIINGIAGVAQRSDFASRAIVVELPAIAKEERVTEEKLWADFEEARPRILGALLDILSDALRLLPAIELEGAPRLADFARLGTAVERSLGWPPGSFLRTLDASQSDAVYDALDAEAITDPLIGFAKKMGKWEGTMTKLLDSLDHAVGEEVRRRRSWPPNASQLGIRIRRIAPGLRDVGVHVEDAPAGRDKDKHRGIRVWVDPPGTAGTAGTPDGGP